MSRWTAPLAALAGLNLSRGTRREIERAFDNNTPVPLARSASGSRGVFSSSYASSGFLTYLQSYGEDAVIHPIVSRLSKDTAAAAWGLWTKSATGKDEDRRTVRSHAVLDFLDHPNDFQTFAQIVAAGQQHYDLVGEADLVLGMMDGLSIPIDMWVLRPDRIHPVADEIEFLRGWIYTSPADGDQIPIPNAEMLRILQPSPIDPYRGMGPIQALMRDLNAQRYSKDWQAAFFQNSARPGGVIEIDRHLGDAEWDEMNDRWRESHQGITKAHRVAILEHGAKWVETSMSLRDMQMAEMENVSRDKALVAFGMPKSALGIVEDVNRANADAGEYLYQAHMIRPRLREWRSMLNTQLLPKYGARAKATLMLDFEDPVPADGAAAIAELEAKSKVLVALLSIPGAEFDADKVLDMLDWPDLGYRKVEPVMAASELGQEQPAIEPAPAEDDTVSRETSAVLQLGLGHQDNGQTEWDHPAVDAAMRWKVIGHPDTSCCDPCLKNLGKLYRNRQDAWSDYPNGKSYIKCVGEQFGNHCRCRVIKRRED